MTKGRAQSVSGKNGMSTGSSHKVHWTPQEDDMLRKLVKQYGVKKWAVIADNLKPKQAKQCRRRWQNVLNASLKEGEWSPEEDAALMAGHKKFGNRWTEIAKIVGGRTDNAVKNRFMAISKRKAPKTDGGSQMKKQRSGKAPTSINSNSNLAGDPNKPNLFINIPKINENDDNLSPGANNGYVNFTFEEMKIMQELCTAERGAESLKTSRLMNPNMPPNLPRAPTSTRAGNAATRPSRNQPAKLERTLSKEVLNLLNVYRASTPLASAGGGLAVAPPSTTKTLEPMNFSYSMMPSTAKIMKKLYAIKDGGTPRGFDGSSLFTPLIDGIEKRRSPRNFSMMTKQASTAPPPPMLSSQPSMSEDMRNGGDLSIIGPIPSLKPGDLEFLLEGLPDPTTDMLADENFALRRSPRLRTTSSLTGTLSGLIGVLQ